MRRALRRFAVVASLAAVAGACSTISLPQPVAPSVPAVELTTTTTEPPDPTDLSDRFGIIVTLDADGSVGAMWVDGSVRQEIGGPDETRTVPTWTSADGQFHWARSLGAGRRIIETVNPDSGAVQAESSISAPPVYLAPAPGGRRIAYLGPGADASIDLGLVDQASGTDLIIGSGPSLFFTWSPNGRFLAQHVGDLGVTVLPVEELVTTPLESVGSADWTVPYWIDNRTVLAVHHDAADPAIRTLAAFDIVDGTRRDIVRFGGQMEFVPNPARTHVAIQATEQAAGATPAPLLTAFRQEDEPPPASTVTTTTVTTTTTPDTSSPSTTLPDDLAGVPDIPPDELVIVDLATSEIVNPDLGQAAAFTWSPIEDKLAVLVPGERGLNWSFWRDGLIGEAPSYTPSDLSTARYLPFFTQFAETSSWWSPDGRTFVFAGSIGDESGIWVQPVNLGAYPTLIDDADYAFFAPPTRPG